MVDFRISPGRLFHVDAAIHRKYLPPCCFLLMVGSVSNLEFEFLSGRIHFFRCNRSVKYVGVFFVENSMYSFSKSCLNS